MRILILGGAGFIGSSLTLRLVSEGYTVRVFTRSGKSIGALSSVLDSIELEFGDFQDEYALKKSLRNVDVVYHLITTTFPNTSIYSGIYDVQTNLVPAIRLLEECEQRNVKKLVYLSSGGTIYGNHGRKAIVETDALEPISIYGNSKKLIEVYLDFFDRNSNLTISNLRVSNPFGPRQNPYGAQGLVAVACAHLLDGRKFPVIGDGLAVRDYLYIDDLVEAMTSVLELSSSSTMNISSGVGRSVNDVLSALEEVSGKRLDREYLPARADLVRYNVLSNKRALRELNWTPMCEFTDGLRETWEWLSSSL